MLGSYIQPYISYNALIQYTSSRPRFFKKIACSAFFAIALMFHFQQMYLDIFNFFGLCMQLQLEESSSITLLCMQTHDRNIICLKV